MHEEGGVAAVEEENNENAGDHNNINLEINK